MANKPVTWQQLTWWRRLAEGQTEHQNGPCLNGFKHGMVVGAKQFGLSILTIAALLGFSTAAHFKCLQNGQKMRKYAVSGIYVDIKALLESEVRGERLVEVDRKASVAKITTFYKHRSAEYRLWTHNNLETDKTPH